MALINWFKNKITFANGKTPALNATNLNNLQSKIESDLSDYIQDGLKTIIDDRIAENKVSGMPIGSGCDFFGNTPPEDFMFADGSAISRTTYAELFAIIGTAYGAGDGSTTFNLPDKRECVSVMFKEGSEKFGTLGEQVGSNETTLTADNLPNQTGSFGFHGASVGSIVHTVSGVFSSSTRIDNTYRDGGSQVMGAPSYKSITFNNGGSSTPFSNIQQSLVCNYIIKVK